MLGFILIAGTVAGIVYFVIKDLEAAQTLSKLSVKQSTETEEIVVPSPAKVEEIVEEKVAPRPSKKKYIRKKKNS